MYIQKAIGNHLRNKRNDVLLRFAVTHTVSLGVPSIDESHVKYSSSISTQLVGGSEGKGIFEGNEYIQIHPRGMLSCWMRKPLNNMQKMTVTANSAVPAAGSPKYPVTVSFHISPITRTASSIARNSAK